MDQDVVRWLAFDASGGWLLQLWRVVVFSLKNKGFSLTHGICIGVFCSTAKRLEETTFVDLVEAGFLRGYT